MSPNRTAVADQVAAASRDALTVLDVMAQRHRMQRTTAVPDRWLRRLVDDAARRPCQHLTSSPEPVFVVAHQRRAVCAPCQQDAAAAVKGSPEDTTCDRCRRPQDDGLLYSAMTTAGPLILALGLCRHCLPAIRREPAPTTTRPTRRTR